jgi:hypothetical protein
MHLTYRFDDSTLCRAKTEHRSRTLSIAWEVSQYFVTAGGYLCKGLLVGTGMEQLESIALAPGLPQHQEIRDNSRL